MERLGSIFWSGVMLVALLGMIGSAAAPIALASPIVKITQPGHEQVVHGEFVIDVSFRSDSDEPITRIDLLIDDDVVSQYALNSPRTSGTQSFKWTFDSSAGSKHTIGARAVDSAGEAGMATITVTVERAESRTPAGKDRIPPVINIYYPAQGAELHGEVEIKAEASDNEGVMAVFFYLDGKFHTAIMNTGPYTARWNTENVADGPHVLQAKVMDDAENEAASAEVTVFVNNHDMTTASPESLAPEAATTPSVPTPGAEAESSPAAADEPMMATAAGDMGAHGSRVGYVPSTRTDSPAARTSAPRMLSGLPHSLQPAHQLANETDSTEALPVATADDPVDESRIATRDLTPRLTVPRTLASSHAVEPMTQAERDEAPVDPQVAAAEAVQRMTLPAAETEGARFIGADVQPGEEWTALGPVLQLTPDREMAAARTTMPGMPLVPAEQLVVDEASGQSLVVRSEPQMEFGSVVAGLDSRITLPERSLSDEASSGATDSADMSAFHPREDDSSTMRIAVLPERASRAAIPADGRLTRPGEPTIAPVASMDMEQVQVLFDSETLDLLAAPEFAEGISMAPLREIFEHSDGKLYWYPVEKRVEATRAGTEMSLKIGDAQVRVNDETQTLQIAPYIKQGRTMVPLQFLADTLDITVTLNPETGQICLTSNNF
ncbi:MAG: Ig-like domain-containing protein [Armatimonadota bacterium]